MTRIHFPTIRPTRFDRLGVILEARLDCGVWTTTPPKDMPPPTIPAAPQPGVML